ncbi:hypothetical protein J6590_006656 [Homalodisca vitripennis]|nr:hypothetical protein J6590_006656 [Homalodisca vitripennis]
MVGITSPPPPIPPADTAVPAEGTPGNLAGKTVTRRSRQWPRYPDPTSFAGTLGGGRFIVVIPHLCAEFVPEVGLTASGTQGRLNVTEQLALPFRRRAAERRLESDAVTDLTPGIWNHIRLQIDKKVCDEAVQIELFTSNRRDCKYSVDLKYPLMWAHSVLCGNPVQGANPRERTVRLGEGHVGLNWVREDGIAIRAGGYSTCAVRLR